MVANSVSARALWGKSLFKQVFAKRSSLIRIQGTIAVSVELRSKSLALFTHGVVPFADEFRRLSPFGFVESAVAIGVKGRQVSWAAIGMGHGAHAAAKSAPLIWIENVQETAEVIGCHRLGSESFGGNLLNE